MKKLVVGFDIGDEFSQVCFFDEEKKDTEFLCENKEKKTYLLPNTVFLTEKMEWHLGYNALKARRQGIKGEFYDGILENVLQKKSIEIGQQKIKYEEFLLVLVDYYITKLKKTYGYDTVDTIIFTLKKPSREIVEVLKQFGNRIRAKKIEVISYSRSYLHFVFRQEKEIWNNNIGMFDYSVDGMRYYQIDIVRRVKPLQIRLKEHIIDAMPSIDMLEQMQNKVLDRLFLSQLKEVIGNTILSSIFLTGVGFLKDWLNEALKVLCSGRRVFKGQNLYAKGACYCGYYGEQLLKQDYQEISIGTVQFDIGIRAYYLQKEDLYPIIIGGKEWYNTQGSLTVCLDNSSQIEFFYRNIYTKEIRREIIEINELPARPNKTTKLQIDIEFITQDKGMILIKDKGFGEWYPKVDKVYKKEFYLI